MNKSEKLVSQLFAMRNRYGEEFTTQKLQLLAAISKEKLKSKKALEAWHEILLFLLAYPDNASIEQVAFQALQELHSYIQSNETIRARLYNSGMTHTKLCAAFGFEIVKWLTTKFPRDVSLSSFEASDEQIQSILSVVMPKVESEILQDGNAVWNSWIKRSLKKEETLLDKLVTIFDQSDIRPEVKDELWGAIGVNVEINFSSHLSLPASLIAPYYHTSIVKPKSAFKSNDLKVKKVILNKSEAERIIKCGRMILVRHLREIDPISFTSAPLVTFYQLRRGLSIALMGMVPKLRHPVDSYMGYVAFKNGLPVAYAGSWILFDSGRIGLNIFPAYRGGESQYIFQQVLKLHAKVYHLNRFTVDPYQIGKDNSDGLKSGAFWTYYHAGFRPIREEQKKLADAEALNIKSTKGYRTPTSVLAKLANSRMEILLEKAAVRFDATDLSRAYLNIVRNKFEDNRKLAEELSFIKLAKLLQIKNYDEEKMKFILKNWCVLLLTREEKLRPNRKVKATLKKLFESKANGSEENYISGLQQATELKYILQDVVNEYLSAKEI
jgi:hypothetical protein